MSIFRTGEDFAKLVGDGLLVMYLQIHVGNLVIFYMQTQFILNEPTITFRNAPN